LQKLFFFLSEIIPFFFSFEQKKKQTIIFPFSMLISYIDIRCIYLSYAFVSLYIVFILYLLIIVDILVKLLFIIFFYLFSTIFRYIIRPLLSHLLISIYRLFNHKFCETILLIFLCLLRERGLIEGFI
jgi:hypothetical protein